MVQMFLVQKYNVVQLIMDAINGLRGFNTQLKKIKEKRNEVAKFFFVSSQNSQRTLAWII